MPATKHGLSGHPIYRKWGDMKRRCKRDPKYTRYGITVCERWANDVAAFHADMGDPPKGMTLDRIDGTKGYEPGNCRWATYAEQNRNLRSNARVGDRLVADIADEVGVSRMTIKYRATKGLPLEAPPIHKRTHCKAGHEWTEANTYVTTVKRKDGNGTRTQRFCRQCRAKHQADLRARRSDLQDLKQLNPKRTGG